MRLHGEAVVRVISWRATYLRGDFCSGEMFFVMLGS